MRNNTHDRSTTIGILGGMGPRATTAFMNTLLEVTPAETDQDHLGTIVVNDPSIPDRTAAILGEGANPVEQLQQNAKILEDAGADVIVCPCNSFHYFYDEVRTAVSVDFLNMIEETAAVVRSRDVNTVGILGTEGTIAGRMYHRALSGEDIDLVVPADLDRVMDSIYAIKRGERGEPASELRDIFEEMRGEGAEVVIAACTEIPIVIEGLPGMVDPMDILATACLRHVEQDLSRRTRGFTSVD